jgi:hypothetical protein
MTDSEKKILEGFLSKTLKIDSEDMAGLYNEAGELITLDKTAEADALRIKKLKGDSADQFKRGLKEGAEKIEKAVKDKYGIESDNIGVELIDEILGAKIEEVKGAGEDISKHPEVLKMKLENDKLLKAKDKEWQGKLDALNQDFEKRSIKSEAAKIALAELRRRKPILPKKPEKVQTWEDTFVKRVLEAEYQKQGDTIVVLRDGKPLQDEHGYTVTYTDYVNSVADDMFEFYEAEDRSSSGNRQQSGSAAQEIIIKDKADFIEKSRLAKTPEERIKIAESYEKIKQ